ncbi:hypothetical protein UlMin_031105 [Ulmus minor]
MSCNGCRVLRKGCSDNCMLRQCLQWIESPQAQAHATLFVAKFFGRAGLMSFIAAVPEKQRPALFQSLLYESVGRTVNPVNGAVGLLWTGNWNFCQSAVETVLRGGALGMLSESVGGGGEFDNASSEYGGRCEISRRSSVSQSPDLDLCLTSGTNIMVEKEKEREVSPTSEESETTTLESGLGESCSGGGATKLLRLFV